MERGGSPYLIDFPTIGEAAIGYISVAAVRREIPFAVKRVFWTYATPDHVTRGRHAHRRTETVLVAVVGRITVFTELTGGATDRFVLDSPSAGLYLPPACWRTMTYAPGSVQLAFASTAYSPADYIRDYDEFRRPPVRGAHR